VYVGVSQGNGWPEGGSWWRCASLRHRPREHRARRWDANASEAGTNCRAQPRPRPRPRPQTTGAGAGPSAAAFAGSGAWAGGGEGRADGRGRGAGQRNRVIPGRPEDGAVGGDAAEAVDCDESAAEPAYRDGLLTIGDRSGRSPAAVLTRGWRSSSTQVMRRTNAAQTRGSRQPSPAVSCRTLSMK
jgi:hypothetical protein